MALISLRGVRLEFGGLPLLDGVDLHVEEGDRLCLLGANGAGKSSLLKLLAGNLPPDAGAVVRSASLRISYLPQEAALELSGSALDVVCPATRCDAEGLRRLEAERLLERQGLDPTADFVSLSGGSRRRVLLARALLGEPDVVLLDEPTNHLDIEAIQWLEAHLLKSCRTFLFVTHDRAFLRRIANRIVELDRGRIVDWACDYDTFLKRKEEVLQEERRRWEKFEVKLRMEEAWLRQGVKARTSRNQGRLRNLLDLRETRAARRVATGSAQFAIQEAGRSGEIVLKAEGVHFGYEPGRPLLRNLDTVIFRGDRVGVLGPNGCGKTTLVRLLLGDGLAPRAGRIVRGSNLQIAYSDQLRAQLDDRATLLESVADGREFVLVNDVRRHVVGYLGDFLFPPERVRQPVGALSGGERSRLLLARLFALPSNVLVLDEPTNDLDLDTLELLEEQLAAYGGTVIAVSHDRAFLNNVVTETLVFEKYQPADPETWLGADEGWSVNEYVGGYDDWLLRRRTPPEPAPAVDVAAPADIRASAPVRIGLSYNERRELEALPAQIERLETAQARLHAQLADPGLFGEGAGDRLRKLAAELAEGDAALETLYLRWHVLEEKDAARAGPASG